MHLRMPSFDRGVTSFVWAVSLGLYLFVGMLAVGISRGTAVILSAVAAFGIFFLIRLLGGDEARRRAS